MEFGLKALFLSIGGLVVLQLVLRYLRLRAGRRLAKLVGVTDTESFHQRYEHALAVFAQLEISTRHFGDLCNSGPSAEEFTLPFVELLSVSDKTEARTFAQLLQELDELVAESRAPDAAAHLGSVRSALQGQFARLQLRQRDDEHFPQLNTFYWLAVAILAKRSRWINLPLGSNESCEGLIERGLQIEIGAVEDLVRSGRPFGLRDEHRPAGSGTSRQNRS